MLEVCRPQGCRLAAWEPQSGACRALQPTEAPPGCGKPMRIRHRKPGWQCIAVMQCCWGTARGRSDRWADAGLRVVVETHGGHFWSTQGSVQRPLDVTSLRIDAQERMGLQVPSPLVCLRKCSHQASACQPWAGIPMCYLYP